MPARIGQRRSRRERGQALVEFALVSVVFFMLIFGLFDFVRLLQSWVTVQHAAREGARFAITGKLTCDDAENRPTCIIATARNATVGLSGGGPTGDRVLVSYRSWDYPDYPGSGTEGSPGEQCDAIEVKVTYSHEMVTPIIKAFLPGGINLTARQRMINEPFGPCT